LKTRRPRGASIQQVVGVEGLRADDAADPGGRGTAVEHGEVIRHDLRRPEPDREAAQRQAVAWHPSA
jgi:hypothetical protein